MGRYESVKDVNFSKGFIEVPFYVERVTDSLVSAMILLGVFIIISFGVQRYTRDWIEAISIGSFFTFLVTLFFWIAGFANSLIFGIVIAITIICFGLLWFTKKSA